MRLDHYMKIGDNDIHLAQLIYSILIIAGLLAILIRTLHKSITKDFLSIELIRSSREAAR